MVEFEKALGAVKVIKDQIQYNSQSLLNLARGYFSRNNKHYFENGSFISMATAVVQTKCSGIREISSACKNPMFRKNIFNLINIICTPLYITTSVSYF